MPIGSRRRMATYFRGTMGRESAREFIRALKDPIGRQKINAKIRKAEIGNFGIEGQEYRHLFGDLWELKISYGPGYRVYFALEDDEIILLLCAGDKSSQAKDIQQTKKNLQNHRMRRNRNGTKTV